MSGVGARLKTPHKNIIPVKKTSDPGPDTGEEEPDRTRRSLANNTKLFPDQDVDLVEGLDQVKPVRDPKKSVIEKMKERHGVTAPHDEIGGSPISHRQTSFGRHSRLDRQSSQRSELFSGGLLPSTFSMADLEVVQPLTRYERNENLGMKSSIQRNVHTLIRRCLKLSWRSL